jgi:5-methylcytosine-specific restriction endonuclease McrA
MEVEPTCSHSKERRGGTTADRRDEVLLRYGLPAGQHPDYQIDHLIPLCLGGSDDFSNLWPQPRQTIEPKWNAEAKDRLEHLICAMVCNGQLDIATAQQAFAKDWIAAYHKYYAGH